MTAAEEGGCLFFRLEIIEILKKQNPTSLLDVVEFTTAPSIFQRVSSIFEGGFVHITSQHRHQEYAFGKEYENAHCDDTGMYLVQLSQMGCTRS